ncbi:MAG: AzlC family ABC transporter permease [Proteobacteria bacterium]|nr:AzlC family ABC transporter permease [Pseudomonadota bacterium]
MSTSTPLDPGRHRELFLGARDTFPLLLGAAPFGLIFGALSGPSGLPAAAALAMSALVFAGSSQFIALTLLGGGAGIAVIVFTTFIVNLRHALYAATLLPHVSELPLRWRVPLAFWLTDETFAVVQHRYAQTGDTPLAHWYYLGSCLAMYGNWLAWTAAGLWLGHTQPWLTHAGLEFAMVATFTGIVAPMLRQRPALGAALAAATVAVLARDLPYKIGLMLAALAGVIVGVWLEERGAAPQIRNAVRPEQGNQQERPQ